MDKKSEHLAISFGKSSWLEHLLYSEMWNFLHEKINKYVVQDHKMLEKRSFNTNIDDIILSNYWHLS